MTEKEVQDTLNSSIEIFKNKDHQLLDNDLDVNERSLTHKLAEHIQSVVAAKWSLDVDCEYNRFRNKPKKIDEIKNIIGDTVSTDATKAKTVYPDIIVHKRGSAGPNIIVIEAKKNSTQSNKSDDVAKLKKIKSIYQYEFAVFVNFDLNSKQILWELV